MLHAWHVPLTGTALSLNQALVLGFLTRSHRTDEGVRSLGLRVSNITALLKSLSPAGKRLTPMLAIATQGLLFSIGCFMLGATLPGVVLGSVLLALWGIIQPIALTVLVFGLTVGPEATERVVAYYQSMLRDVPWLPHLTLMELLGSLIGAKVIAAIAVAVFSWHAPAHYIVLWQDRLLMFYRSKPTESNPTSEAKRRSSIWLEPMTELFKPLFIIPVILTGVFYWFAEHQWAPALWAAFRPFAAAYLMLVLIQLVPWSQLATKFERTHPAFSEALVVIQTFKDKSRSLS